MDDSLQETEWWWIDFLENEFDPVLEKDLQLLLEHSEEDRASFENFRLVRQWVSESDPAKDIDIEARLPSLRAKVMRAVMAARPSVEEKERAWDAIP